MPTTRGTVREVFWAFLRLGQTSFGGPIAHLGYFREEFVRRREWLKDRQYAGLLALCQFLPGPASSQMGFALGLLRAGGWGAFAAWFAFTLPSASIMVALAAGIVAFDDSFASGAMFGLKAVAIAVVTHAVWGMARTLAPDLRRILIGIAAVAFALLVPGVSGQLCAIALGIAVGFIWCRDIDAKEAEVVKLPVSRRTGVIAGGAFVALLALFPLLASTIGGAFLQTADAFYRAGAFVFGGGHVVLPLLQSEPVLTAEVSEDSLLAGYGAAQAMPGPLFTLSAYLGFDMASGPASYLNAIVALLAIFIPGILLLLAALPFWSALLANESARAAVAGANAAVVGILAAVLIDPMAITAVQSPATIVIAVLLTVALFWGRVPVWCVVLVGFVLGIIASLTGIGVHWPGAG